ncbi:helix-turn-helix domain-containing protein [Pseudoalteromonas sp. SS15]|uniref:helix-turn-helix domain-containing protein n=1 Tax=Pseudoalteromonas sp. SS15 TaxID=3139393 RepID=UPI003BA9756E
MNKQVNISKEKIRQLRMSKGWPQEQLALASGLSVRTVQRVESEGAASLNTAMSLAATFEVDIYELQQTYQHETSQKQNLQYGLFIGLVILTLSLATQPLQLPDDPYSTYMSFMSYFLTGLGILIMTPSVISAFKHKQYFALVLASIGTLLSTMLAIGVLYLLLGLSKPMWELFALGVGGVCLLLMSLREFNKSK